MNRPYNRWLNQYERRKGTAMMFKLWPAKPYFRYLWNRGTYS